MSFEYGSLMILNLFRKYFVNFVKNSLTSDTRPSVLFQACPITSDIAILHGSFRPERQSPFNDLSIEQAIKKGVEHGVADLPGWHGLRIKRILQLVSKVHDNQPILKPGLDPMDPFIVPWSSRVGLASGQTNCLLCIGLGSRLPVFRENFPISKKAYDEFLKLKTPEDCEVFAKHWGPLGNWKIESRSYVPSDPSDVEVTRAFAKILYARGFLPEGATALNVGLRSSVFGEPLEAWLWHVSRINTWRTMLSTSNHLRQLRILNRPIDILKIPDSSSFGPGMDTLPGFYVPCLSQELFRLATNEELEALKNSKPWDYAVHQEGGFLRFLHDRFRGLRHISKNSRDASFQIEIVKLIRQLLQETLAGKVSFQPFSMDGFASVEPNSLLSWLYMEFSNRHADILGGTVKSVPCANPDCQKLAVWLGFGRPRKHCSNSCKTAANKKRRLAESTTD
jgi:hypothetical protein